MDTSTPQTGPSVKRSSPLINRNFALLWVGQGISNVGDTLFDTTLILWIATQLAGRFSWAPLAVSGVLLAVMIPTVLLGPVAGAFVDRWDKRRTMIWMDGIRAGLIVLLVPLTGLVPGMGSVPVGWQLTSIYAVVLLATTCSLFFGPSRIALIGDVVPVDERARASGLGQITQQAAMLIGPPLAGPVFFGLGARWALLANAASFGASFVSLSLVRAPRGTQVDAATTRGQIWLDTRDGVQFFARNRVLRTLGVSVVLIMLGGGAINALDIFFVTHNLHTSAGLYGLMSAALGAGALLGAVLVSVFARRLDMARVFSIAMLLTPLMIIIYSRLTSFVPALAALFLAGIPMAALNIAAMPLLLHVTPRQMIGRVSGVLNPLVSLASIGGIVLAGLLAGSVLNGFHLRFLGAVFGPTDTIFTAAGLLGLGGGLYALAGLRGVSTRVQADETAEESASALA